MANGVIGKLSLDISDVKKNIEEVNQFLGKIGANIDIGDSLSKKISNALKGLVEEAKKAGEEVGKALEKGHKSDEEVHGIEKASKALKQYYDLKTKAEAAYNSNRLNQAMYYDQEAEAINKAVTAYREEAEATERVIKAKRNLEATRKSGIDRAETQAAKEAMQE